MGEGSRDANARALSDDVQCFLRSAGGIGAAHSGSLGSMPPSPSLEGISPGSLQSALQHVLRCAPDAHQMRIRCAVPAAAEPATCGSRRPAVRPRSATKAFPAMPVSPRLACVPTDSSN